MQFVRRRLTLVVAAHIILQTVSVSGVSQPTTNTSSTPWPTSLSTTRISSQALTGSDSVNTSLIAVSRDVTTAAVSSIQRGSMTEPQSTVGYKNPPGNSPITMETTITPDNYNSVSEKFSKQSTHVTRSTFSTEVNRNISLTPREENTTMPSYESVYTEQTTITPGPFDTYTSKSVNTPVSQNVNTNIRVSSASASNRFSIESLTPDTTITEGPTYLIKTDNLLVSSKTASFLSKHSFESSEAPTTITAEPPTAEHVPPAKATTSNGHYQSSVESVSKQHSSPYMSSLTDTYSQSMPISDHTTETTVTIKPLFLNTLLHGNTVSSESPTSSPIILLSTKTIIMDPTTSDKEVSESKSISQSFSENPTSITSILTSSTKLTSVTDSPSPHKLGTSSQTLPPSTQLPGALSQSGTETSSTQEHTTTTDTPELTSSFISTTNGAVYSTESGISQPTSGLSETFNSTESNKRTNIPLSTTTTTLPLHTQLPDGLLNTTETTSTREQTTITDVPEFATSIYYTKNSAIYSTDSEKLQPTTGPSETFYSTNSNESTKSPLSTITTTVPPTTQIPDALSKTDSEWTPTQEQTTETDISESTTSLTNSAIYSTESGISKLTDRIPETITSTESKESTTTPLSTTTTTLPPSTQITGAISTSATETTSTQEHTTTTNIPESTTTFNSTTNNAIYSTDAGITLHTGGVTQTNNYTESNESTTIPLSTATTTIPPSTQRLVVLSKSATETAYTQEQTTINNKLESTTSFDYTKKSAIYSTDVGISQPTAIITETSKSTDYKENTKNPLPTTATTIPPPTQILGALSRSTTETTSTREQTTITDIPESTTSLSYTTNSAIYSTDSEKLQPTTGPSEIIYSTDSNESTKSPLSNITTTVPRPTQIPETLSKTASKPTPTHELTTITDIPESTTSLTNRVIYSTESGISQPTARIPDTINSSESKESTTIPLSTTTTTIPPRTQIPGELSKPATETTLTQEQTTITDIPESTTTFKSTTYSANTKIPETFTSIKSKESTNIPLSTITLTTTHPPPTQIPGELSTPATETTLTHEQTTITDIPESTTTFKFTTYSANTKIQETFTSIKSKESTNIPLSTITLTTTHPPPTQIPGELSTPATETTLTQEQTTITDIPESTTTFKFTTYSANTKIPETFTSIKSKESTNIPLSTITLTTTHPPPTQIPGELSKPATETTLTQEQTTITDIPESTTTFKSTTYSANTKIPETFTSIKSKESTNIPLSTITLTTTHPPPTQIPGELSKPATETTLTQEQTTITDIPESTTTFKSTTYSANTNIPETFTSIKSKESTNIPLSTITLTTTHPPPTQIPGELSKPATETTLTQEQTTITDIPESTTTFKSTTYSANTKIPETFTSIKSKESTNIPLSTITLTTTHPPPTQIPGELSKPATETTLTQEQTTITDIPESTTTFKSTTYSANTKIPETFTSIKSKESTNIPLSTITLTTTHPTPTQSPGELSTPATETTLTQEQTTITDIPESTTTFKYTTYSANTKIPETFTSIKSKESTNIPLSTITLTTTHPPPTQIPGELSTPATETTLTQEQTTITDIPESTTTFKSTTYSANTKIPETFTSIKSKESTNIPLSTITLTTTHPTPTQSPGELSTPATETTLTQEQTTITDIPESTTTFKSTTYSANTKIPETFTSIKSKESTNIPLSTITLTTTHPPPTQIPGELSTPATETTLTQEQTTITDIPESTTTFKSTTYSANTKIPETFTSIQSKESTNIPLSTITLTTTHPPPTQIPGELSKPATETTPTQEHTSITDNAESTTTFKYTTYTAIYSTKSEISLHTGITQTNISTESHQTTQTPSSTTTTTDNKHSTLFLDFSLKTLPTDSGKPSISTIKSTQITSDKPIATSNTLPSKLSSLIQTPSVRASVKTTEPTPTHVTFLEKSSAVTRSFVSNTPTETYVSSITYPEPTSTKKSNTSTTSSTPPITPSSSQRSDKSTTATKPSSPQTKTLSSAAATTWKPSPTGITPSPDTNTPTQSLKVTLTTVPATSEHATFSTKTVSRTPPVPVEQTSVTALDTTTTVTHTPTRAVTSAASERFSTDIVSPSISTINPGASTHFSNSSMTSASVLPTTSASHTTEAVILTTAFPTVQPSLEKAVYVIQFTMKIDGQFHENMNTNDSFKNEVKTMLLKYVLDSIPEITVELFFRSGSINCDITSNVPVTTLLQRNLTAPDYLEQVRNNTITNKKDVTTSAGAVDAEDFADSIQATAERLESSPCGNIVGACAASHRYTCVGAGEEGGTCVHKCDGRTAAAVCGEHGECFYDWHTESTACRCLQTSYTVYHGDRCEETTKTAAFVLAMSLGIGGAVVFLLVTCVIVTCYRARRSDTARDLSIYDGSAWENPTHDVTLKDLNFRGSTRTEPFSSSYYRAHAYDNEAYQPVFGTGERRMFFPDSERGSTSTSRVAFIDDATVPSYSTIDVTADTIPVPDEMSQYSIKRPRISARPNEVYTRLYPEVAADHFAEEASAPAAEILTVL